MHLLGKRGVVNLGQHTYSAWGMGRKAKKVFVVIPAYNEEKRIGKVIKDVERYVDCVVVVDDGSADQTASRVKSKKAVVLRHMFNLGQGAALQTGFEWASGRKADIIVTFDADGQFMASEIPSVIEPILKGRVDVALGSRFLGKARDIPFSRFLTLKAGVIFTNIFSGIRVTDTYNGFRAFSPQALKKIHLTQNRMAHASEIIDLVSKHNLRFTEVPVTVLYSKQTFNKGLRNINSLKLFFDLMMRRLY